MIYTITNMKHETNDQFLDRIELERLEFEGQNFKDLKRAMRYDLGYQKQRLDQAIERANAS